MARISVVVATFRGKAYLTEQLESLRLQTRTPDEVILSDDCSGDGTAEAIAAYIDEYGLSNWRLIAHKENHGFIGNFRLALAEATGEIIFPCDQDDIWKADKLEVMERVFLDDPQTMAVNGSFEKIDGEGKPLPPMPYPAKTGNHGLIFRAVKQGGLTEIPYAEILRSNISPGCTMAVRREVVAYYLSHTEGVLPHDWELNVYAAMLGKLYYLDRPVIGYRLHGGNVIGLQTKKAGALEVQRDAEGRQALYRQEQRQLRFLEAQPLTDPALLRYRRHFASYLKLREKCLIGHNPFVWPLYWLHYPAIRPQIRARELLGDLLFALRLHH